LPHARFCWARSVSYGLSLPPSIGSQPSVLEQKSDIRPPK
jgi:hypothetical protein